jgi:hypothetical protein
VNGREKKRKRRRQLCYVMLCDLGNVGMNEWEMIRIRIENENDREKNDKMIVENEVNFWEIVIVEERIGIEREEFFWRVGDMKRMIWSKGNDRGYLGKGEERGMRIIFWRVV